MFLKGANGCRPLCQRLTRVEYKRLVKAAAVANMNCLRVWEAYTRMKPFTICVTSTESACGKT